ncbi:MAG: inositol monophosphatase family protein [Myxococcota bacterium]|nr:inositol monophosphatase family protein [Myxococcota bacterium]
MTLTELAIERARAGGDILRRCFANGVGVRHKGDIDLVTDADLAAESEIISGIRARHPDHAVLAEESGEEGQGDVRWIIDPLDGTVNFAHGIPHFSVLIAVQERSHAGFSTQIGVVYDPMREELFVAERGRGATLNGKPIHVSKTARLIDAMGVTGFAYDRLRGPHDNHAEFCALNLVTQGVRRFGSAGLDLAYVASGRFDLYWEYGLKPWDLSAGALLVVEAGGKVTDLAGGVKDPSQGGEVIASNGLTHAATVAALASAAKHPVNDRAAVIDHLPPAIAEGLRR